MVARGGDFVYPSAMLKPEVLAAAKQRSRSTEALLVNATARAVEGNQLLLTIGSAPLVARRSRDRAPL